MRKPTVMCSRGNKCPIKKQTFQPVPNLPSVVMNGVSKGKGRAIDVQDTERTPLLNASTSGDSSTSLRPDGDVPHAGSEDRQPRQRSIFSQIMSLIAVGVIIAFFGFLIFLVFVWATLRGAPASRQAPETIVNHATRWRTTSIEVANVTGGFIVVSVSGQLGVDTEWILGIDPDDDSAMASARRATGRWLVSAFGGLHANAPTTFSVWNHDGTFLLNCTTSKLDVPVLPNSGRGAIRMSPVTVPLRISPTDNTTDLLRFAEATWLHGAARVKVTAAEVVVETSRKPWWLPNVRRTVRDAHSNLEITGKPEFHMKMLSSN